jgi:ubiquitin-protein ligase
MDSIIRSISDKENVHDGEITDGEEIYATSLATTTASSTSTTTTTVPVVVGELSSEIELSVSNTNMQRSFNLQQHRMVSGVDDIVDANNGVSHEALLTAANVVVADEEIPVANKVIDDDDDDEEDDDDYEYEDDDYAAFSGFIVNNDPAASASFLTQTEIVSNSTNRIDSVAKPATIEEDVVADSTEQHGESSFQTSIHSNVNSKPKWRQPSEEAVSMSLRAEKETSGNKRRLALDLYRIMNQDTNLAGFTLVPKSEDSMDTWTIKLFQFDEDSKLAQDMKVLSVPYIELEMNFPDQYPFEPPFVRVTQPRFRRQTGFVMNGALCMELLTKVCSYVDFKLSILKNHSVGILTAGICLFSITGWLESY